VFVADVEGGDAEVILLPPDRASGARWHPTPARPTWTNIPHRNVPVTGGTYEAILAQLPSSPANRRTPEIGALLDEQFRPCCTT